MGLAEMTLPQRQFCNPQNRTFFTSLFCAPATGLFKVAHSDYHPAKYDALSQYTEISRGPDAEKFDESFLDFMTYKPVYETMLTALGKSLQHIMVTKHFMHSPLVSLFYMFKDECLIPAITELSFEP